MKKPFFYITSIILLLQFSCKIEEVNSGLQPFFDMNNFIDKELAIVSKSKSITKKVSVNGKIDEKVIDNFNLEKDLTIFKNANINKVAWLDKYEVDSIMNGSQLVKVVYTANNDKMKTRKIELNYDTNTLNSISIENNSSNLVNSISQHLRYFVGKGYTIESFQETALSGSQDLKIEVEYL